jgi:hypothetical protein
MKKLLSFIIALTLLATSGCIFHGDRHHHDRGGNPPPAKSFNHSSAPSKPAPHKQATPKRTMPAPPNGNNNFMP